MAATIAAYAGSLDASFHFDDHAAILGNPALRELGSLWPPWHPRWLGDLTFALNLRLGGTEVLGFHLVNLAVHLGNALLVRALAAATLRTPGLRDAAAGPLLRPYLPVVAALLFALHPLATQAVTYVVQRYASLAALLYLAALLLWLEARRALDAGGPRARWALPLAASVLAAAGAMKTKEIAVTLPLVAAGAEVVCFGARPRRRLLLLLPLAATTLLVPLAHAERLGGVGRITAETATIPRWDYLLTQTRVVLTYLRLVLLPVGQNLDHDVPISRSLLEPPVLGAAAALLAVIALAAWLLAAARRAGRVEGVLAFLGTAWFFATLSVESSVIPIRDVIFEHRTYLPLAGAALALATGLLAALERLPLPWPRAPGARVAAALLVTAGPLGLATRARNEVWRDDLTLWSDVVAKSPGKARGHDHLGIALLEAGRADEALRAFETAVRLDPSSADALVNLATARRERGEHAEALRLLERAVEADPRNAIARNNLGGMYELQGRRDEALRQYLEAVRLDPRLPDAQANLARLRAAR